MNETTTHPTRGEIDALTAYLPLFSREGYQPILEWGGGEKTADGAVQMPWPVYQKEVEEFFLLAGRPAWCDYTYQPQLAGKWLRDPGYIRQASLDQVKTLLTYCVRGERFCDGHWGAMIEGGFISALLRRLAEIGDQFD